MCLRIHSETTTKFQQRAQTSPEEEIVVWKILNRVVEPERQIPAKTEFIGWDFEHPENQWIFKTIEEGRTIPAKKCLTSSWRDYIWQVGENISDRPIPGLTEDEKTLREVSNGFHVYLECPPSFQPYGKQNIVKLMGKMKDIVAGNDIELVFHKLTLTQAEFDRVIADQPLERERYIRYDDYACMDKPR
jgi:hypothetical protein